MAYRCHSPQGFAFLQKQDGRRVEEFQNSNEGESDQRSDAENCFGLLALVSAP